MWKHTILFSLYSVTEKLRSLNSFASSVTKREKNRHYANCYISSFKLFHLGQTRVYSCWQLQWQEKSPLKPYTSGSIFTTPLKQRSNSPIPGGPYPSKFKFLTPWAQKVVKCLRFAWGRGLLKFQFDCHNLSWPCYYDTLLVFLIFSSASFQMPPPSTPTKRYVHPGKVVFCF